MKRLIAAVVLAAASGAFAQNRLVNGSFQDPAFARLRVRATVIDGATVQLDTGGIVAHRTYEFDIGDGSGVAPGNILVDLSGGAGRNNAAYQLAEAINADSQSPATASYDSEKPTNVYVTWKGAGGDGAENTSSSTDLFVIENFNEICHGSASGHWNTAAILGWLGDSERNASVFTPPCRDGEYASLQSGDYTEVKSIYQTVSGVISGNKYLLTGLWSLGDNAPPCAFAATLYDGSGTDGTVLGSATVEASLAGSMLYRWVPFAVSGQPTGDSLTVEFKATDSGGAIHALHIDDVSLIQSDCIPPTISTAAPVLLYKDIAYDDSIVITGSGFVPGQTTVRIRPDSDIWIEATDVKVDPGGERLTCDLAVPSDAFSGYYAVIVEVAGCGGNTLGDAFNVITGLTPFANGSFELSDPGYNECPVQPLLGRPDAWEASEVLFGGDTKLFRDDLVTGYGGPLPFRPNCPPPDGWHYAACYSSSGGANVQDFIYQTFQVTANQLYTYSGYFAGSGNNIVNMEMRDGPFTAPLLKSAPVSAGGGTYDWTFGSVSGSPTTELMTVGWRVEVAGPGPHMSFGDNMVVAPCTDPVTVTGITPSQAVNDGTVDITALAGTGFAGTPEVMLTKTGIGITATNVHVVSGGQITCRFNLTGVPSGKYDVIVRQSGCIGRLSEVSPSGEFLVAAADFINGSFEDPTAPANCGGDTLGVPSGWNRSDTLNRDGSVHVPSCSPLPDGMHYGSMTNGGGGVQRAWQVLATATGDRCRLTGQFAGGGDNTVKIMLLDGDENGSIIAETIVHQGPDAYPWTPFEVQGQALSNLVTVVWEMSGIVDESASHADAVVFALNPCNDPFADSDGDQDVDQKDFALLQVCLTGPGPGNPPVLEDPAYCRCFNRNPQEDSDIDQQDIVAFVNCGSGPGVPALTSCDGGE